MPKRIFSLLIFCVLLPGIFAAEKEDGEQQSSRFAMLNSPLMMTFSVGSNINTAHSYSSDWLGARPDNCAQIDLRVNYGFSPHWSAYANLGISFYELKTNDKLADFVGAFANAILPGLNSIHPSFSLGAAYLMQKGRWQIMPRAGFGNLHVKSSSSSSENNGTKLEVKRDITPYFAECGFGCGFRMSRVCSLILDVDYRYPLQPGKITVSKTVDDGPTDTQAYKSRSWANDFTVSLGIQFQTELNKTKGKK